MNETEQRERAQREISRRIPPDGLREPRVIHIDQDASWSPALLRTMVTHEMAVMERGGDITVFFDEEGVICGWRDDGRTGGERPAQVERQTVRDRLVEELDLPEMTRLGQLEPVPLPPVGWTYEGVLFCAPTPDPAPVLRVWINPVTLKVIQCLYEHGEGRP